MTLLSDSTLVSTMSYTTPPQSPKFMVECPPIQRLNYNQGPSVVLDADIMLYQRGGIRAGDFIKPDTGMTRSETRRYIVKELEQWLCGPRLASEVEKLMADDVDFTEIVEDVSAGRFPAGRLYMVLRTLDPSVAGVWGAREVGQLCYSICAANLEAGKVTANEDIQNLALGFIDVDRLPGGDVIRSLWNRTPFDPLREAAPLPETEEAEETVEEVTEEATVEEAEVTEVTEETVEEADITPDDDGVDELIISESEESESVEVPLAASVDAQIDAATDSLVATLQKPVRIEFEATVGVLVAAFGIVFAYLWMVAALVSARC